MNVDAGRGKLFESSKVVQAHWDQAERIWTDANAQAFRHEVVEPMEQLAREALRAMDRLDQLFREVRRDCAGEEGVWA